MNGRDNKNLNKNTHSQRRELTTTLETTRHVFDTKALPEGNTSTRGE